MKNKNIFLYGAIILAASVGGYFLIKLITRKGDKEKSEDKVLPTGEKIKVNWINDNFPLHYKQVNANTWEGSKGNKVIQWQKYLNSKMTVLYGDVPLITDGYFGENTLKATKNIEKVNEVNEQLYKQKAAPTEELVLGNKDYQDYLEQARLEALKTG